MKHHLTFFLAGIITLLLLVVLVPTRAEAFSETVTIQHGEYKHYDLYDFNSDDTIELDIWVANDVRIDVYILSDEWSAATGKSEFEKYKDGEYFDASFQRENIAEIKNVEWDVPDDDDYVLVIDNKDNGHAGDADSGQTVTVNVKYDKKEFDLDLVWILVACGVCCILPVGIIIAIVVYRKRKSPYSSQRFPFMGRTPPWSGQQSQPPHPPYPGYHQPPAHGPPYPQRPPGPPQQGGYGQYPPYGQSYSLKNMKPKTEGRSSLPKPSEPRPSSPPASSSPPTPSSAPLRPTHSPPSPYPPSASGTGAEPTSSLEEKMKKDTDQRYVIVQNIGEYVSGSKLNIHDSVVQRTSLGSTGSGEGTRRNILTGVEEKEEPIPDIDPLSKYEARKFYESILKKAWEDGYINESEFRMLKAIRESENITLDGHREIEKKIVEEKGVTPMRCPECGGIGEYVVEKRGYHCPRCGHDI